MWSYYLFQSPPFTFHAFFTPQIVSTYRGEQQEHIFDRFYCLFASKDFLQRRIQLGRVWKEILTFPFDGSMTFNNGEKRDIPSLCVTNNDHIVMSRPFFVYNMQTACQLCELSRKKYIFTLKLYLLNCTVYSNQLTITNWCA